MTINKIIKLVQEAGFQIETDWAGQPSGVFLRGADEIVRFYHIVRNAVLEEAADACIETGSTKGRCDAEFDMADACAEAIRAMKEQNE